MHISHVSIQVVLIFKKLCANPTREPPRLTTLVHVPNVPRQVAFALEDTGTHIAWEILDVTDSMDHLQVPISNIDGCKLLAANMTRVISVDGVIGAVGDGQVRI